MKKTPRINNITTDLHPLEILRLMTLLIDNEASHSDNLAAELHAKKSALFLLNVNSQQNAKAFENKTLTVSSFTKDREVISLLSEELRRLCIQIYPRLLTYVGLEKHLQKYFRDYMAMSGRKLNINIDVGNVQFDERIAVGIFKLCQDMVLYFEQLNGNELSVEIKPAGNRTNFRFSINRGKDSDLLKEGRQPDLIKAWLLYLRAEVGVKTNWKNEFIFSLTGNSITTA